MLRVDWNFQFEIVNKKNHSRPLPKILTSNPALSTLHLNTERNMAKSFDERLKALESQNQQIISNQNDIIKYLDKDRNELRGHIRFHRNKNPASLTKELENQRTGQFLEQLLPYFTATQLHVWPNL